MCCVEFVGSSKIDETWSMVVLRVEAFSEGFVAPFKWLLVNEIKGSSSLPGVADKQEVEGRSSLPVVVGKRDQGVGAPFQKQLENERKL